MKQLPADWFLRARLKMRHLQLFAALDEHRNIHRAAETLGMSQPAASKLLGELEYQLDVPLFERQPRGVEPNWYGEVLIRHSRAMLAELNNAGEELSALRNGNGGRAAVGTVAPGIALLGRSVEEVQREHPRVQIAIDINVSHMLVQGLAEGNYDFVLARIPDDISPKRFVYEEIGKENLCFVCRKQHPLADRKSVTLRDMASFTWVLEPPDGLLRQRMNDLLLESGITPPQQIIDTRSVLVSMALIDRTDAITVISQGIVDLAFDPNRFHILPFSPALKLKPFGIVRLQGRKLSPGALQLIRTLHCVARPETGGT